MLVFLSLALLELKGQWKVMRLSDFSLDLRFLGGLYLRVNSGGTLKNISDTDAKTRSAERPSSTRPHPQHCLFHYISDFPKEPGLTLTCFVGLGEPGSETLILPLSFPPLWVFFFSHSLSFLLFFSFIFFFTFFFLSSAFPPGEEKRFCKCCQLRWSR